jgi:adenosylcobyric acid synthase
MVLGTGSHVGKSLLVTALCRILRQDGYNVAPFKAQNMALNSAATPDGREIGRAQALQAEAAGVAPSVDMNPILLKPTSDTGSQAIVLGRIWRDVSAADYHLRRVLDLFPLVCAAFDRLAKAHDIIVLEGAGSPAEINLRATDIVNMRMAEAADARCVLVGDIDRGGVFAALLGTLELLEPAERRRIGGFIINKFRGDITLLTPGIEMFEKRAGLPCLGVVPYLRDVGLDEEDGVAFGDLPAARRAAWADPEGPQRRLRIAVVPLPQIANFTDFDPLVREPGIELVYAFAPEALIGADVIVLPGTKSTLAALRWLKREGFISALRRAAHSALLFGICGGLQLLGERIEDPFCVEGGGAADALGLLALRTVFGREKTTIQAIGHIAGARLFGVAIDEVAFRGYEIHNGETERGAGLAPFASIVRNGTQATLEDGAVSADGRVAGTYVHGLFDEDRFRHAFIASARTACGLAGRSDGAQVSSAREARIDRLAAHVRAALDIPQLLALQTGRD